MRLERELSAERATRQAAEQERDRLRVEVAASQEAVGSRDRQVAEMHGAQESLQANVEQLVVTLHNERAEVARLRGELGRLSEVESSYARLLLAHATVEGAYADAQAELDQVRSAMRVDQDNYFESFPEQFRRQHLSGPTECYGLSVFHQQNVFCELGCKI